MCVCSLFLFASKNDDHCFSLLIKLHAGNQYILQGPTQEASVLMKLWVFLFLLYLYLGFASLYS